MPCIFFSLSPSRYEGKVCVIVNIAEGTPYSDPHFYQLQDLYERYKNQGCSIFFLYSLLSGLMILVFPCYEVAYRTKSNPPLPEPELKKLLRSKYGVTFPIFSTVTGVNPGPEANPLFYFCRHQLPGATWYQYLFYIC